jgi:hypothetical protein
MIKEPAKLIAGSFCFMYLKTNSHCSVSALA